MAEPGQAGGRGATRITVRLTPRASNEGVVGFGEPPGEVLRVRVAAPPVDGRANEALVRLLADALDLPRGAVRVVSGHASRQKVVEVEGRTLEEVRTRLASTVPRGG